MAKFSGQKNHLLRLLLVLCFGTEAIIADGISVTFQDRYLAGHVIRTSFPKDWLQCAISCHELTNCVSYNFDQISGACDLSDHGLQRKPDAETELTEAKSFIFHQIRPVFKNILPKMRSIEDQCDCSCPLQSPCVPNPDANNRFLPSSCKDLREKTGTTASGAYNIRGLSESTRIRVYCHMKEIPGCGGGGWTLVMKLNGSKTTFQYESQRWTNTLPYEIDNGKDLTDQETKMPTYWSTPFTRLCLGMKNGNQVNWIGLNYTATSLYDVISAGNITQTGLPVSKWKSLLNGASIQNGCTLQGFNMHTEPLGTFARARIGIVGYPKNCSGASHSRIGFGTSGSFYGMNNGNSCGNEARNEADNGDVSRETFGYIMLQ